MIGLSVYVSNYVFALIIDIFKNAIRFLILTLLTLIYSSNRDYNGVLIIKALSRMSMRAVRSLNDKPIIMILLIFTLFIISDNISVLVNYWIRPQNICNGSVNNYQINFTSTDLQYSLNTTTIYNTVLQQNMTSLAVSFCNDLGGTTDGTTGLYCGSDYVDTDDTLQFDSLLSNTISPIGLSFGISSYYTYGFTQNNSGNLVVTGQGIPQVSYSSMLALSNSMFLYDTINQTLPAYVSAGSLLSVPFVQTYAQNIESTNMSTAFRVTEVLSSPGQTNIVMTTTGTYVIAAGDNQTTTEIILSQMGYNLTEMFDYNSTIQSLYQGITNSSQITNSISTMIVSNKTASVCTVYNDGNYPVYNCASVQYYYRSISRQPLLEACGVNGAAYLIGKTSVISINGAAASGCRLNSYVIETIDCSTPQLFQVNSTAWSECNNRLLNDVTSIPVDSLMYDGLNVNGIIADYTEIICEIAYNIVDLIYVTLASVIILTVMYLIQETTWRKLYTRPIESILVSTTDGSLNCSTMSSKGTIDLMQLRDYKHNVLSINGKRLVCDDSEEIVELDKNSHLVNEGMIKRIKHINKK